ncbi:hypothetical protein NM688_g4024 [Phlebia brevispora]|uniref:Uncharacterized protein n=1 Tax=Phlebia brevispora TaxID=194682 RepID=A0ACC1T491_9APHY|nr:hypothetical protein NM688_g4024 [Phlebia brevispora]
MTSLHVYFSLRNQKAFQRTLEASRPQKSYQTSTSSSGGRSFNRPSPLSSGLFTNVDVNARDRLGRTVLHLAASATDASALEYVRMLLAHPNINVNMVDSENHWTALHRALYCGNIPIAMNLIQRSDIDISLKDYEGWPGKLRVKADLLTWGANRNATLGVGDADDRAFPEQITVESAQTSTRTASSRVEERFTPVRVQDIVMSRLHTAVVSDEDRTNLYVCGFGSGGRLGPGQHTQYSLVPVSQLPNTIVSVALGQDHTLALTNTGEVLSWGLNRFAQLGYVVETTTTMSSRVEEPIQATPRKVTAGLKGKFVLGVAACKTASACWTASEVYSWGTNSGQLGYDKIAHPVQILPRVVTKINQPVISVTITDNAMACLLKTNDVVCIYNDNHFRVNFPQHAFPSEMKTYRPPQAIRNASIDKITSCDSLIAALTSNGELFTFSLGPPAPESAANSAFANKSRELVKPQRVWALRKKFSSVKDVALGADGSIIICTESGHVFVRARTTGKAFKFQRMPYMQRVIKVAANNTGAYAALRVDAVPAPVPVLGNTLAQDMALILPYGAMPPPPAPRLPSPTTAQGRCRELRSRRSARGIAPSCARWHFPFTGRWRGARSRRRRHRSAMLREKDSWRLRIVAICAAREETTFEMEQKTAKVHVSSAKKAAEAATEK